jgi:hypothetical protein
MKSFAASQRRLGRMLSLLLLMGCVWASAAHPSSSVAEGTAAVGKCYKARRTITALTTAWKRAPSIRPTSRYCHLSTRAKPGTRTLYALVRVSGITRYIRSTSVGL